MHLPTSQKSAVKRILTVKPRWASKLLGGEKTWELQKARRLDRLEENDWVAIAVSKTGKVFGIVQYSHTEEMQVHRGHEHFERHQVPPSELAEYAGKREILHAHVFKNPQVFATPVTYTRKNGAVVIVVPTVEDVENFASAALLCKSSASLFLEMTKRDGRRPR